MSAPRPEWLAARTVHLAGGCRAFNGLEPTVEFFPRTLDGQIMSFESRRYGSLYTELREHDVAPLGFEFLTNSLEAKGLAPTNWRTYHPWGAKEIWPCNDQMDKWSQIAYAAAKIEDAVLWDLARRISHQLRVCAWRLYQLSDAYHAQLRVRTTERDFKTGVRFEDGFTWLGYLAVQVFLVDACVLRDYLAEFFFYYICPESERPSKHVTSMAGLRKLVLSKVASSDPLFGELQTATGQTGWLFLLGAYRDLSVHCVPLARAESKLWALTTEFKIKGAKSLAGVSLPLPSEPSGIAAARTSVKRTERLAEELRLLTSATRGEAPSTDALVYCYTVLDSLTGLTARISDRSPVAPRMPQLTDKDIIGRIEVRRVWRLKFLLQLILRRTGTKVSHGRDLEVASHGGMKMPNLTGRERRCTRHALLSNRPDPMGATMTPTPPIERTGSTPTIARN